MNLQDDIYRFDADPYFQPAYVIRIVEAARKYDKLEQLGWYDPGSKRFCYSDEKEAWPDTKQGYTIPVFTNGGPK